MIGGGRTSVLHHLDDQARALLDDVGLSEYHDTQAVLLSYGRKRALEIATTLALERAHRCPDAGRADGGDDA